MFTEVLIQQPEGQSQSLQQYTRNNKQTYTQTNKKEHQNNKPKYKNSTHLTKIPHSFYNILTIIYAYSPQLGSVMKNDLKPQT